MIPIVVAVAALVMIGFELAAPGRSWPQVRGWWARVAALNAVQVGVVLATGTLWDDWMLAHRPWSAETLGPTGGALVGYLAITLVYYGWHRARHENDFLWRWLHQLHHSPQRIEILTSFYKHPLEILLNGALSSAILYLGVGVGTEAAAGAVLLSGLAELVYHWNVRTPYAMGFVFQRPESHCVHHERGRHTSNFGDLPLWDWLFGTLDNPPGEWRGECGFDDERERCLADLLLGRDVNRPARVPTEVNP